MVAVTGRGKSLRYVLGETTTRRADAGVGINPEGRLHHRINRIVANGGDCAAPELRFGIRNDKG